MNAIMVDNWLMQEVVWDSFCRDMSEEYAKYLTAIVLWDEIYYPKNFKSTGWSQMPSKITSIVHPIDDSNELFGDLAEQLYQSQYSDCSKVVAQDAIRYLILSDYMNCDYFPSGKRQEFLKENNPCGIVDNLNRFSYLHTLDTEINERFEEIFRRLELTHFEIKRPVLVDFIIQNTPSDMSYVDFAIHLKHEGPVIQYRKYLEDIEKALEKNEWNVLIDMIHYSEDAVRKVISLDKKCMGAIDVIIAPIPSLSFSKKITPDKRKIHLSFLDDLSKFAFNGRRLT